MRCHLVARSAIVVLFDMRGRSGTAPIDIFAAADHAEHAAQTERARGRRCEAKSKLRSPDIEPRAVRRSLGSENIWE